MAALLTCCSWSGNPSAPVVTLIVFGNGICAALGFPAFQAMLPDLVPVEDLPGAIALSSAQYNLGRVVGPALAGIVIVLGGYAWAEACNAASFLAVVAVLLTLTLPVPARDARATGASGASIKAGFRFVRREPGLRVDVVAMCVNTFLAAPFIALVPAMATKVLDSGHGGTSVLVTAQGIGAVLMALSLGTLDDPLRTAARARDDDGIAAVRARRCTPYAPVLAASALALLFVGALYLGALSTFMTIAQLRAPAEIRGRVLVGAHRDPRLAVSARRGRAGQDRRHASGCARRRSRRRRAAGGPARRAGRPPRLHQTRHRPERRSTAQPGLTSRWTRFARHGSRRTRTARHDRARHA